MKTIVEHVSLDEEKRIIVISDIHGNIHRLKKLLDKVSLKRDETLVLCGDLLEKGPSSLKTLLFLYQLSLTQKMVVLKGNCDMVMDSFFGTNYRQVLSYINRRKNSLFLDLAQEFNLSLQTEEDVSSLFKVSLAHYLPQLRWIKELPHIVRTENFLFVHAGLDYGIDYLNNSDSVMNQEHYFFDEWIQPKTMIVGHMPVSNYNEHVLSFNPLFSQEKNLICIDGGNVIDELGQLNALIISKGLFSFDYVDDFELTSSMYDQMGSRDSLNIT